VQLRGKSSEQRQQVVSRAHGGARLAAPGDQAAVVHFGSRALAIARSQPPPPDASLSEPDDGRPATSTNDGTSSGSPASAAVSSEPGAPASGDPRKLSDADQQQVDEMKRRDREVRSHEQAHKSAGGSYAGSVTLTYQRGADGKRYAAEGEVPIDVSPVAGDPAATLRKMEVVMRAARAPASPSGADQAVAAQASHALQQARAQLAAERYAQSRELVASA
jgi:SprA-related family